MGMSSDPLNLNPLQSKVCYCNHSLYNRPCTSLTLSGLH